jgi:hypothetical protein
MRKLREDAGCGGRLGGVTPRGTRGGLALRLAWKSTGAECEAVHTLFRPHPANLQLRRVEAILGSSVSGLTNDDNHRLENTA